MDHSLFFFLGKLFESYCFISWSESQKSPRNISIYLKIKCSHMTMRATYCFVLDASSSCNVVSKVSNCYSITLAVLSTLRAWRLRRSLVIQPLLCVASFKGSSTDMKSTMTRGCVNSPQHFPVERNHSPQSKVNHLLQQIIHLPVVFRRKNELMCGHGCKQLVEISSLEYLIFLCSNALKPWQKRLEKLLLIFD